MNIRWNTASRGIYNSWKNVSITNRQSLVTTLFGIKGKQGTNAVLNLSIDGDTYSKGAGVAIAEAGFTSKGTAKGNSSAKDVLAGIYKLIDTEGGFAYEIRDDEDLFRLSLDKLSMSCSYKQLQRLLNYNNPKTMEVDGNTITFENNCYYKFTDSSGKEHKVLSLGGCLMEGLGGGYSEAKAEYMNFWNCIARKDPTFVPLEFSDAEVRSTLRDIGIQTGWFTINVGGRTQTQYLSQGKNTAAIYSKEQYDQYYNFVQSEYFTKEFIAGAVIKIAGEEYTVEENGKIPSVPYGSDIWDIEYPGGEWTKWK